MSMLGVTPPGGTRLDLDTVSIRAIDVLNAGMPGLQHQAVRTPSRDGEVYIRTVLQPRFLILRLELAGDGYAVTQALREQVIRTFNPVHGLVTIDYTPVDGGPTYLIDGVVATGLEFERHGDDYGEFREAFDLSLRCPDPAWRESTPELAAVTAGGVGLDIPLEVPIDIEDTGQIVIVTNAGHLASYPVITATGTFTGLRIRNLTTDQRIWFPDLAVVEGQTLAIDMNRRTATLDGANVLSARSADSESWALVPGDNQIEALVSTGIAEVTLTYETRLLGL